MRSESVGRRIRDAELARVPLMLVVGDREERDGTVSVRDHGVPDARTDAPAAVASLLTGDGTPPRRDTG